MSDFSIGLTFSGGGYRAAAYHLGTLWMLHHLKVDDGTLLEHVEVLSTISVCGVFPVPPTAMLPTHMLGFSVGATFHMPLS